ncbi:MAG TPA: type II toxin-antitoxin system prevent-host-death family antitoxin [Rhizomicrobium sp.]|nr:type II toxin-antitoxin system prevent-host-death family antitoxin [Rhizomicrobium sp.]
MDDRWPVQDAKARFSEMLRKADVEPQVITHRGEPRYEIRAIRPKRNGKKPAPRTLADWWLSAPKVPEFKLPPRRREKPRKIF